MSKYKKIPKGTIVMSKGAYVSLNDGAPIGVLANDLVLVENDLDSMKRKSGNVIWPDGTITLPNAHKGRFVEYEESDLEWMIPLGSAEWEMVDVAYLIDNRYLTNISMEMKFDKDIFELGNDKSFFKCCFPESMINVNTSFNTMGLY